jgi:hypothetical protein
VESVVFGQALSWRSTPLVSAFLSSWFKWPYAVPPPMQNVAEDVLFPDMTIASILAVTIFKSGLSIHVFLYTVTFFSAHQRLLSE